MSSKKHIRFRDCCRCRDYSSSAIDQPCRPVRAGLVRPVCTAPPPTPAPNDWDVRVHVPKSSTRRLKPIEELRSHSRNGYDGPCYNDDPRAFSSSNYGTSSSSPQPQSPPPEIDTEKYGRVSPSEYRGNPYLDGQQEDPERSLWDCFPSHDREQRNASAGIQDGVIMRDFADQGHPPLPAAFDLQENAKPFTFTQRLRNSIGGLVGPLGVDLFDDPEHHPHISKKRSIVWKKQVLTGIMALFRSPEHQTGHRTSITIGGRLEYPELEMLPVLDTVTIPSRETARKASVAEYKRRKSRSERSRSGGLQSVIQPDSNRDMARAESLRNAAAASAALMRPKSVSSEHRHDSFSVDPIAPFSSSDTARRTSMESARKASNAPSESTITRFGLLHPDEATRVRRKSSVGKDEAGL